MKYLIFKLLKKLYSQTQKNFDKIMSKLSQLEAQVDELQVALDAEQAQVAELLSANTQVIEKLNESINELESQIEAAGTEAEFSAVVEKLKALKADVESTVADAPESTTTQAPEDTTTQAPVEDNSVEGEAEDDFPSDL